jgi:lysophospholipase L1-like esterase
LLSALLPIHSPAADAPRIFASSNQSFAQGTTKRGGESIRESRKVIYFHDDLKDLVLGYANYFIGSTGENDHGHGDVNVKFGLEYQGKFYPFLLRAQRIATCLDGATLSTDPLEVSIKAGTYGAIRMWEQKLHPDSQANSWLWSTEGDPAFNEGSITHSDPTRDWTLGGAPGETAATSRKLDSNGGIMPSIAHAGTGITTKGAIISVLDSQRKGSGFSFIATVKDGVLAGWFQQKAGSGYSQDIWVGASGMGGYGPGGPTQTHGPCVIAGTPTDPKKSVLLIGDSIAAGFGSSDKRGDIWRNFGIYARALSRKTNVCNTAIPGLTAYACDYRYKRTRDLIKSILNPQIVLICLGSNDIDQSVDDSKSKTPLAALKGHLGNIASWWATNCGSEIWFGTILPRVTKSDAIIAAPIPKPGFESNGTADQINAAIRDKSLFPATAEIIGTRVLVQNPADPTQWRTDHGLLTDDGTHPNDTNGIPWIAGNLIVPTD